MIVLKIIFVLASLAVGVLVLGLCFAAGKTTPPVEDMDKEQWKL